MTPFTPTPHGQFELHWQGQVLHLCLKGEWNAVAVQILKRELQSAIAAHAWPRWALLVDARDWGGATPEALEAYIDTVIEAHGQGLSHAAALFASNFHELMGRPVRERLNAYLVQEHFFEPAPAQAWLAAQGFALSNA
jgi:hypothetical protein